MFRRVVLGVCVLGTMLAGCTRYVYVPVHPDGRIISPAEYRYMQQHGSTRHNGGGGGGYQPPSSFVICTHTPAMTACY